VINAIRNFKFSIVGKDIVLINVKMEYLIIEENINARYAESFTDQPQGEQVIIVATNVHLNTIKGIADLQS